MVEGLENLSDEQLLRLTSSRPAAFDVFYVRHERLIVGYFRRRTSSADVAADLTAETFVAALDSVGRYRSGDGAPAAWLLGIARHTLLRSVRRGRVEDRARRRLGMERLEFDDAALERVDRIGGYGVEELLGRLSAGEAAAVRARVFEELAYAELALRLACSELVARKRVSRGLATLRRVLEDDE